MMIMMIKGTATSWRSAGLFLATFYSPFGLPFRLFAFSPPPPPHLPPPPIMDFQMPVAIRPTETCLHVAHPRP